MGTPFGKSLIVISKKLFIENTWQIRFEELLVGEIEDSNIDESKRKTVKEYMVLEKEARGDLKRKQLILKSFNLKNGIWLDV